MLIDDSQPTFKNFIEMERQENWFNIDLSVYRCRFNQQFFTDELYAEFNIVRPESMQNAVTKRRAEYLAGRYCAKKSLGLFNMQDRQITTGNHRCPVWPNKVIGSISHCENQAIAITTKFSLITGIGIDIENQVSEETYDRIKHLILNDYELTIIQDKANDINQLSKYFTLAFSLKESFFKAAYPRVKKYFDFSAISITSIDETSKTISFKVNQTLHTSLYKGLILNGQFCKLDPTALENIFVTAVILEN